MNIALITIAYKGYGKFADQWLGFISQMKIKPDQIVIVLGEDHGLSHIEVLQLKEKYIDLPVKFIRTKLPPLMGPMRNKAVRAAHTEWVMYMSIDDMILPNAIEVLEKYEKDADYISISWESSDEWNNHEKITLHRSKTPEEMALVYHGKGFIIGHSPFRRSFWEAHHYKDHDYPNAPFVADLVEAGARFVKTIEPCTRYLRRENSHSARLGKRRQERDPNEKRQANKWKNNMQRRIIKYYRSLK
jgi:hypothetical protein